ncbi:MAG: hypothetical protein HYS05_10135 [Acidobacteria bacterium]|nr:hypothetical protein [Acidobacteriota bacterium]
MNFAADESLRYQFKIEGYQGDWSAPSEQRIIAVSVAPGRYRVLVRAVRDGVPSDRPASVSFTVSLPVWQRWWFVSLLAFETRTRSCCTSPTTERDLIGRGRARDTD